jgi:hypothetical protein
MPKNCHRPNADGSGYYAIVSDASNVWHRGEGSTTDRMPEPEIAGDR